MFLCLQLQPPSWPSASVTRDTYEVVCFLSYLGTGLPVCCVFSLPASPQQSCVFCMWLGWECQWSSLKPLGHLTLVWCFDLSNKINRVIYPVFLASLHCTCPPPHPRLQEVLGLLLAWSHLVLESLQPTSSLKTGPMAKVKVLFAPSSLIWFYFHLSFKMPIHAGLSQSTAILWDWWPWRSIFLGTARGKGTKGEDAF